MEKKENIELKIGSPEMKEWQDIIDAQVEVIRKCKINETIASHVLELAKGCYKCESKIFEAK